MTNNWFECKIKYEKTLEEGKIQKVNESYLVFAFSFTDAEARIIEEMKPFISGEFEVANIKKVRLWELFDDGEGDRWYRCKVYLITLDEESGTLFAFQKVSGEATSQDMGSEEAIRKWWHYMAPLMEVNEDESPISIPLEEMFHLD